MAREHREALLEENARAINDQGGAFELDDETHLSMAVCGPHLADRD